MRIKLCAWVEARKLAWFNVPNKLTFLGRNESKANLKANSVNPRNEACIQLVKPIRAYSLQTLVTAIAFQPILTTNTKQNDSCLSKTARSLAERSPRVLQIKTLRCWLYGCCEQELTTKKAQQERNVGT